MGYWPPCKIAAPVWIQEAERGRSAAQLAPEVGLLREVCECPLVREERVGQATIEEESETP